MELPKLFRLILRYLEIVLLFLKDGRRHNKTCFYTEHPVMLGELLGVATAIVFLVHITIPLAPTPIVMSPVGMLSLITKTKYVSSPQTILGHFSNPQSIHIP
jgi:hypothetical protein